ncbi:MAG: DmsE family decaheme c-type cytochrome [Acidobacteria bacterium]|nr:DmsE family decaheme c-type cytochrome [Acidobacteriota bacterium]
MKRRNLIRAAVGCISFALALLASPAFASVGEKKAEQAQTPQAGYVGSDTCTTCHEGFDKSLATTKHAFVKNPRTPMAAQGCETCHGPGEAHANDQSVKPVHPRKIAAKEATELCMGCHNRAEHSNFEGSAHDARGLTCVNCHSVHRPQSENAQLVAATRTDLCVQCHRDKVKKLERSGHMPVREGKMECTSCHSPHGSQNVRMLRVGYSINEACESCHTEKRGPTLYEHAPVRESCVTCHDPHGSTNDRMLVAKAPFLCQRCHMQSRHPSTIYDGVQLTSASNRIVGRGCINCHTQIHGSNHPSGFYLVR